MKIEDLREQYLSKADIKLAQEYQDSFLNLKSYWNILQSLIDLIKQENSFKYTECLGDFYSCEAIFLESIDDKTKLEQCEISLLELKANISYLLARAENTSTFLSQLQSSS